MFVVGVWIKSVSKLLLVYNHRKFIEYLINPIHPLQRVKCLEY